MKTMKILCYILFLFSISASAQFGSPYGNRMGGLGGNQIPQNNEPKEPTAAEIEKARTARVDNIMKQLKEDLTLDDLQYIAIRNELLSNSKSVEILMKSEISQEDKTKQMQAIQEKTEKTINSYLNPSQKEKYQKLKDDRALGIDNKKEKKKKREKEKEQE